ncbi:glutathione-disulfide reductase [Maritimibacter sp. 55A14]|uniref:glutathione-disulfide reductase n=1 Tax=Maritimibacter sp. 55A14 TaxID=2174844 RepID=UPI000D62007B|nr:glutathione-disulfide reductase [Maritimibacter sp. 55A14]PWE32048.1 glutathione-disulfide reductase [Maritimibacter sp. 55A14]
MAFDYDLFVIGGGSGGVRAARVAAETGARVGLAEEYRMGGTCVIRGCVPKKLMVFASGFSHAFEDARGFGWDVAEAAFDWPAFRAKKDAEIARLEGIYRANLDRAGVEAFDARATLAGPHEVTLSTGQSFRARHVLIATGGAPFMPDLPGIEHAISSNDIFDMEVLPGRALVVGGGFIACEFACILNGMGVAVTQLYRGEQILRGFDGEMRGHLAEAMCERGVDLHVGTDVERIDKADGALRVTRNDGHLHEVDLVLYATGRRPSTAGLGLEEAGVDLARGGAVKVDEWSQSSVPSIYAVGDVTDRVNLTPVAIREGAAFVETVFKANPVAVDHSVVASAVFTQPEFGTVGMTEEAARDAGPIEIYSAAFRPMQNILAGSEERVLMKLVVCAETRRVLGVHIIGPGAGEMIQLAGVAVTMGATKEDFDRTVAVHPTMAEELVTMKTPTRTA